MMAYIELETAIKVLRGKAIAKYPASFYMGLLAASNELNNISPADVIPVRHGRWLHRKNGVAYCSECEIDTVEDETEYCPNCGAKMDLDLED